MSEELIFIDKYDSSRLVNFIPERIEGNPESSDDNHKWKSISLFSGGFKTTPLFAHFVEQLTRKDGSQWIKPMWPSNQNSRMLSAGIYIGHKG
jgi:hypothetical protein